MEPLTEVKSKEIFDEITPEMCNLVIEANIKNHTAGPVANAWDAALRKADAAASLIEKSENAPVKPRTRNFWEAAEGGTDTESNIVFVESITTDAADEREGRLARVPSTPRLGRRGLSTSPTKGLSPVRKGSSAVAPGEI